MSIGKSSLNSAKETDKMHQGDPSFHGCLWSVDSTAVGGGSACSMQQMPAIALHGHSIPQIEVNDGGKLKLIQNRRTISKHLANRVGGRT